MIPLQRTDIFANKTKEIRHNLLQMFDIKQHMSNLKLDPSLALFGHPNKANEYIATVSSAQDTPRLRLY
jgi:hypothetical protein